MSADKLNGRPWRRLRLFVLERDRWLCQVPDDNGQLCGAPANTAGHLDPRSEGNPLLADPSRLRAECGRHNYAGGAAITNAKRRRVNDDDRRGWEW